MGILNSGTDTSTDSLKVAENKHQEVLEEISQAYPHSPSYLEGEDIWKCQEDEVFEAESITVWPKGMTPR
jgi:hypothetical protein